MHYTAKPSPPNGPPPTGPQRPVKPSFTTTLVSTLATTRARAQTLWSDGYTHAQDRDTPGRILVTKPDKKNTVYHVDLWWDTAARCFRYSCSCWLFQKMVLARRFDPSLEPECKHGLALVYLLAPARALRLLLRHIDAAPRSVASRKQALRQAETARREEGRTPRPAPSQSTSQPPSQSTSQSTSCPARWEALTETRERRALAPDPLERLTAVAVASHFGVAPNQPGKWAHVDDIILDNGQDNGEGDPR